MARRSSPPVLDAAERYVAHCFQRGGSTGFRNSQTSLLRRFAAHVNQRQVGTVTAEHVESFFYGPDGLAGTCARSTLGRYHGVMKGFFAWCWRRGWCDPPDMLLGGIVHTSTRVNRVRLRLTEAQMWAMVQNARDERDRAMLVFAMHTALRISEILSLRLSDLNLDGSQIRVRIHKTREEDVMMLSPTLARELREWLTHYHQKAKVAPAGDAYLFPARRHDVGRVGRHSLTASERGYAPDHPVTSPGKHIRNMAERANVQLEDGDGWHTVRRSVARIFFDKASSMGHDAALRMTAAFLHHKNTSTTEIYLGLQHEKAKRDEVMTDGFLSDPFSAGTVTALEDYRDAGSGNG